MFIRILKGLFSFKGRRDRKSFLLFHLAFIPIATIFVYTLIAATAIIGYSTASGGGEPGITIYLLAIPFLGFGIALLVIWFAVIAQRCRDFGWSAWFAFLILVPAVGVLFWFTLLFIRRGSSG